MAACGIVESPNREYVLLVDRKYEPFGFAWPGGMQELGETLEETAIREIYEETGTDAKVLGMLYLSSNPYTDPRWHVNICYFVMRTDEFKNPRGGDDAKEAIWYPYNSGYYEKSMIDTSKYTLDLYRKWREKEDQDLFKIDIF